MKIAALARATSVFVSTLTRGAAGKPASGEVARAAIEVAPAAVVSSGVHLPEGVQVGLDNKCPVCQARFRGVRICSRCGADLESLMRLTVRSWQLREAARQALGAGDLERAAQLAVEAQGIQPTESGRALGIVAGWLRTGRRAV